MIIYSVLLPYSLVMYRLTSQGPAFCLVFCRMRPVWWPAGHLVDLYYWFCMSLCVKAAIHLWTATLTKLFNLATSYTLSSTRAVPGCECSFWAVTPQSTANILTDWGVKFWRMFAARVNTRLDGQSCFQRGKSLSLNGQNRVEMCICKK